MNKCIVLSARPCSSFLSTFGLWNDEGDWQTERQTDYFIEWEFDLSGIIVSPVRQFIKLEVVDEKSRLQNFIIGMFIGSAEFVNPLSSLHTHKTLFKIKASFFSCFFTWMSPLNFWCHPDVTCWWTLCHMKSRIDVTCVWCCQFKHKLRCERVARSGNAARQWVSNEPSRFSCRLLIRIPSWPRINWRPQISGLFRSVEGVSSPHQTVEMRFPGRHLMRRLTLFMLPAFCYKWNSYPISIVDCK